MVIGFMVFWPLGFAMLAYIIWGDRLEGFKRDVNRASVNVDRLVSQVSGEIATRSDQLMDGYLDMPEETARAFRGGWFRAGDLAYRDKNGYLYLHGRGKDLHRYVAELEQTVIDTLASFDVEGRVVEGDHASGVWVGDRKIASIGVRSARWVTTHGLSLNADLDLEVTTGTALSSVTAVLRGGRIELG